MTGAALRQWASQHRWSWAALGSIILVAGMMPLMGAHGIAQTCQVALEFAAFYVLVGLGQMLVIALGNGNIDLSIPGAITLAAFVGLAASTGALGILAALGTAIAVGVGVGLANSVLVQVLRIPPMIATLASGFVFQSMAIAFSRGASSAPSPLLARFSTARTLGIPSLALLLVVVSILVAIGLRRTRLGRTMLASGQSLRAARLAGLDTRTASLLAYVVSGIFSALTGLFLAASIGGASLDMGQDYLLFSIAVVVLGGTAITGGEASTAGIWSAGLLLVLSITMLNILGVGVGVRFLVTGLIIISVLALTRPAEP